MSCELQAKTSRARYARTGFGKKYASFLVDGNWTEPEEFFTVSMYGRTETRRFDFANKPTAVRLSASERANNWGFWRVSLTCDCEIVLVEDPNGVAGTAHPREDPNSEGWEQYWLGDAERNESPLLQEWEYGELRADGARM